MPQSNRRSKSYTGFEQGPIRPPSEAYSLLIRVTRNCPWNRCTFCPVYKGARFSTRPVAHVIADIDSISAGVEALRKLGKETGRVHQADLQRLADHSKPGELAALSAAYNWFAGGMRSVFLQDANSLIIKPSDLIEILAHLEKRFPWIERITSYARSHTIVRIKSADLKAMRRAGLNRIHIGLESGSDQVLQRVQKGVTKEIHIRAGRKVRQAGMELSEYVMPGLGGKDLSREHALETADALNRIDPDFIRLRTLAIPNSVELHDQYQSGDFKKCTDVEMAEEIALFIDGLDGINSVVKSDHILNLFQEVEGRLPADKERMLGILHTFLDMPPQQQALYQAGRRVGIFARLQDLENSQLKARAEKMCTEYGITADNVDAVIDEIMKRFI